MKGEEDLRGFISCMFGLKLANQIMVYVWEYVEENGELRDTE